MTVVSKKTFIKKVKDISIGGALTLTLVSAGLITQSCSSNSSNDESDYSYEEVSYSKGIRSHIKEVSPGEFKIMNEESVDVSEAMAIVSYLDGHTDTLTVAASQALIEKEINTGSSYNSHHSGLSNMLLYGGMGYMLGRMLNNNHIAQQRSTMANTSQFYGNQSAYNNAQTATKTVDASRSARTVNARPSAGKSGFFGSKSPGSAAG